MDKHEKNLRMCKCSECGWSGKCDETMAFLDQESWESPHFWNYGCPECEADIETGDWHVEKE